MFKWHHEYCVEVDVPISQVINFFADFTHWPKWMDQCEAFQFDRKNGAETVIRAKIKHKNTYFPIRITEIEYQKAYQVQIKVPFSVRLAYHFTSKSRPQEQR